MCIFAPGSLCQEGNLVGSLLSHPSTHAVLLSLCDSIQDFLSSALLILDLASLFTNVSHVINICSLLDIVLIDEEDMRD